jgi:hypothetical protein
MSTTITPRTEDVYLYQGDDLARIRDLEAEVDAAAPAGLRRIGDPSVILTAAAARDEFVNDAKQRAVRVTVQAMGRKRWRKLVMEHPPRPGDDGDTRYGFNQDTMADPLVERSVVAMTSPDPTYAPNMGNPAERDEFLDSLSDGDFSRIYSAAVRLNAGVEDAPKADLVLRLSQLSAATSGSHRNSD